MYRPKEWLKLDFTPISNTSGDIIRINLHTDITDVVKIISISDGYGNEIPVEFDLGEELRFLGDLNILKDHIVDGKATIWIRKYYTLEDEIEVNLKEKWSDYWDEFEDKEAFEIIWKNYIIKLRETLSICNDVYSSKSILHAPFGIEKKWKKFVWNVVRSNKTKIEIDFLYDDYNPPKVPLGEIIRGTSGESKIFKEFDIAENNNIVETSKGYRIKKLAELERDIVFTHKIETELNGESFSSGVINILHTLALYYTIDNFSDGTHMLTRGEEYLEMSTEYSLAMHRNDIYATYVDLNGRLILAKATEDYSSWEIQNELTYVPSGSYNPNITFKNNGHYELAVEIQPAGSDREVWLLSYPYSENAIRKVTDGVNPNIVTDANDVTIVFYNNHDLTRTLYRREDEGFNAEHEILELAGPIDYVYEWPVEFESDNVVSEKGYTYNIMILAEVNGELKYVLNEEFVNPLIEKSLVEETLDNLEAKVSSINWQDIIRLEKDLVEDPKTTLDASISGLNWQEIIELKKDLVEDPKTTLDASISDVNWQEIERFNKNLEDDPKVRFEASVGNILWMQEG